MEGVGRALNHYRYSKLYDKPLCRGNVSYAIQQIQATTEVEKSQIQISSIKKTKLIQG